MIKQLIGHIEKEQIDEIVDIILNQYKRFRNLTDSYEYGHLFRDEYKKHAKQHSLSWAISSAFPSKTIVCDNLSVSCLKYGKGHSRPILSNEKIELLIFSSTTSFDAKFIKEKCKALNNKNFSNKKIFAFIKYYSNEKQLHKISICLPDKTGKIIKEEVLLEKAKIQLLVA